MPPPPKSPKRTLERTSRPGDMSIVDLVPSWDWAKKRRSHTEKSGGLRSGSTTHL